MGSLKSNKLNNLTTKEWTLYSTSVILFSSKKSLLKRISLIYSKKNDTIGYFSFHLKPKWKKKTYFSRKFRSDFSCDTRYNLIIIDLHDVNSILLYQRMEEWIEKYAASFFETLKKNKYILVIAKDFNEHKGKIDYFPTHQFITQILGKFNFLQTDLWALSNTKKSNYSPTFLLCFKKSVNKPKYNVGLTVNEFINKNRKNYINHNYECPNIIQGFSSIREPEYLKHGATFPQTLIEFFLRIFTEKENKVLDIFSGVGLSLFAAERLQRNAIGIELNPKYVKWANRLKKRKFGDLMNYISTETSDQSEIRFINDDSRNLLVHVKKNSIDLMITSPPYFNILHKVADEAEKRGTKSVFRRRKNDSNRSIHYLDEYFDKYFGVKERLVKTDRTAEQILSSSLIPHPYSGDDKDLGNITSYKEFLDEINQNHKRVFQVLKPGGFAIWIIRDFRDMLNQNPYVNFHSDLATLAIQKGFIYYDLVVWNQNRERKLIHLGGGNTYYNSMTMSFIVILRKPLNNHE